MSELPKVMNDSHIWRETLAVQPDDVDASVRERLRAAFLTFRDRAKILAGEIRSDLPQLTLHDITHIDALWDTASTIVGDGYDLTPTESFVLGGAFLLHDLGMALPAVEGGIVTLKADPRWSDLVTYEYITTLDREPTPSEVKDPPKDIYNKVLLNILQQIHASTAEQLVFTAFKSGQGSEPMYLIDDPEIRQCFGRIMGRVAHSHWWNLTELEKHFQRTIGAPHWCPRSWTIDPLKVACVLRCADAAQIDARRAPTFLKALAQLPESSVDHWAFQEKLNKPYLEEDALVFTTGHAFAMAEASAWWLCLDTLRMVDRELGAVDALFADNGASRFAARRVAGVEEPERLVSYVQTDGWLPINATVHVTDLPRLIRSVGGEELYGRRPEVALRELIQNGSDAISARRTYEHREQSYGSVKVSLSKGCDDSYWLEVGDDGIGMSRRVLTRFLLDFGHSFWGSSEMQREFPGLLSSGLRQIGKYGIGFFSVFMIAEHVQIITRRSDAAAKDTLVLQFSRGLRGRPILRQADDAEQLVDGGTLVRLKLHTDPSNEGGLLHSIHREEKLDLVSLCRRLCPALEANLVVDQYGQTETLVHGGDWRTIDASAFLKRMPVLERDGASNDDEIQTFREKAANNLRFLRDANGDIVGRALITVGYGSHEPHADISGVVAVGGLAACSLSGIAGVLAGTPVRAARDAAKPLVDHEELKRWAQEQSTLVPALWKEPEDQAACAKYIRLCGGDTGDLPICRNRGRWYSASEIRSCSNLPDKVILVDDFAVKYRLQHLESYTLSESVFEVGTSSIPGLLQCRLDWPQNTYTGFAWGGGNVALTLGGAVVEAIAHAWGVDMRAINSQLQKESDVVIGSTRGGSNLKERAIVICRPKEASTTSKCAEAT